LPESSVAESPVQAPALRLLLVEDEGPLAASLGDTLEMLAPETTVRVASSLHEAAAALRGASFDAVLLDLGLPDSQGLDTFHALRAQVPDTALVVVTGRGDDELVAAAFAEGAQEYLVKGSFSGELLVRAVRGAVERQRLVRDLRKSREDLEARIAEQRAAERARGEAETRLRQVIARSPAVLYAMTPTPPHDVTWMSENASRILGFAPEDFHLVPNLWTQRVHPDDAPHLPAMEQALIAGEDSITYEYRFRHADGHWLWICDTLTMVRGSDGTPLEIVAACQDVTAERHLEEQLRQAQKMEAVGQLAGGVAHDFNNLLTAIGGYSELLLMRLQPGDPARHEVEEIHRAGERAATLTRQLLAFSRRQMLQPRVLDLNGVVVGIEPMLRRLIGEHVQLATALDSGALSVKADKTQLDQVVLNLALNAKDAMPEGGRLTIRTRNVNERESTKLAGMGMAVGEYVLIEVEDTGVGMPADVLAKIFEPFFTTKDVGKGTGLGLSTVYGIVKQTGGYVLPESEVGKGTNFRIYLPRHVPAPAAAEPAPRPVKKPERPRDLTGAGRVLLVEDEDSVRNFAVRALKRQGYEVIEASTGREALDVLEGENVPVDIVVSDVVMPEMDGPTLLKELRTRNPDVKVIFISGYPDDVFKKSLDPKEQFAFLAKPFTLPQLAAKVKEELAR
jgi:PAS domain S-box-containing protein